MSTQSMLLLCTGAAASLAGVWSLAGLSESSSLRSTPRVLGAAAVGLVGAVVVYQRAPAALRAELLLPGLFAVASVLALSAGAAKLEAALADRDGPRAVRRASGLVLGTLWGMLAVGAASLELVLSSLTHARFGWAYMLPVVAGALVVFAQRAQLAGAGALLLGRRGLVLGALGLLLLCGGRALVKPASAAQAEGARAPEAAPLTPAAEPLPAALSAPAVDPSLVATASASPAAASTAPLASAAPADASATPPAASAPSPAASLAPPPLGASGQLQVDSLEVRGILEADARGGVTRRLDILQACLAEPKNRQSGSLALKVGVDQRGSVTYSKVTGGDLAGTPLATCLLPVFYKMGFAAPSTDNAHFAITLTVPP